MQDKIINCKALASTILQGITHDVSNLTSRKPALAVVLVGDDPASQIYVKNKKNTCAQVGIVSVEYLLSSQTTQNELTSLVWQLNNDPTIDGILVQLPLPGHLNSKLVIDTIAPAKDVDGFHRYNMGSLALNDPQTCPCTPHGVMHILDSIMPDYHGKHAVVVGTSNIVGRPMILELLNRGATVTACNSKTNNLSCITRTADILITAIGRAKLIKRDAVKDGSIIIDVGMNRLANGKLCGDIDFDDVIDKVSFITPVPGGVGPMTIAMLIKNTMRCYLLNQHHLK